MFDLLVTRFLVPCSDGIYTTSKAQPSILQIFKYAGSTGAIAFYRSRVAEVDRGSGFGTVQYGFFLSTASCPVIYISTRMNETRRGGKVAPRNEEEGLDNHYYSTIIILRLSPRKSRR